MKMYRVALIAIALLVLTACGSGSESTGPSVLTSACMSRVVKGCLTSAPRAYNHSNNTIRKSGTPIGNDGIITVIGDTLIVSPYVNGSISIPYALDANGLDTVGVILYPCTQIQEGGCDTPTNDSIVGGDTILVVGGKVRGYFTMVFDGSTGPHYINYIYFSNGVTGPGTPYSATRDGQTVDSLGHFTDVDSLGNWVDDSGNSTGISTRCNDGVAPTCYNWSQFQNIVISR